MVQGLTNYYQAPGLVRSSSPNNSQSFGNLLDALKSGNLDQLSFSGNSVLQSLGQLTGITTQSATNTVDPNQKAIRGDFRNVLKSLRDAEGAIQSGNQDQITTTQNALQQMMTQFQNDLSTAQSSSTGAANQNTVQTDLQNFQGALSALLDARKSGNQDQIRAAQDTFQKTITQLQTDVPELQQIRGHQQHSLNSGINDNNNANNSFGNNLTSYLASFARSNGLSQIPITSLLSLKV
jgi:hypothetical protein